MIPQDYIDDLLSRTDIVEVIRGRVPLKRAGNNWVARCPFHDEKTPSFNVSATKQFYHCFGCGASGNAIRFLMEYDRLEFPAAIEQLAHLAGIDPPRSDHTGNANATRPLYEALNRAQDVFHKAMTPASQAAAYVSERGLDAAVAETFGLGFAPPGWDALTSVLPDKQAATAAGLLIAKDDGGHYDRFRNRLMFPIRDLRGRIVGFGGRTLDGDKAKYLNSPETPVFHKGKLLYGLYEARQACRELDEVVIVEGYMDVIALAQHGFPQAVATLGTATTADHLALLFRQTQQIVFCFDGDNAGRRAAEKALDITLGVVRDGHDVRFLFLPEGDDPDTLVRRLGAEGFAEHLAQAQALSDLLFEQLTDGLDLSSTEGRAALISRAKATLQRMHAPAFTELFRDRIAQVTRLDSARVGRLAGDEPRPATRQARATPRSPTRVTPIRRAIALLLEYPHLAEQVTDIENLVVSHEPGAALLAELLDRLHVNPKLSCGALIEGLGARPEREHLQALARYDVEIDTDGAESEFVDICRKLTQYDPNVELDQLKQVEYGQLTPQQRDRMRELMDFLNNRHRQPAP